MVENDPSCRGFILVCRVNEICSHVDDIWTIIQNKTFSEVCSIIWMLIQEIALFEVMCKSAGLKLIVQLRRNKLDVVRS